MSSTPPSSGTPYARAVLVNSAVAAVLACSLMVLAHELCHLVTGLSLGIPGTLYPFGVEHTGTPPQRAIMAGSAPLFSLVTGLVMALWQPLRSRPGFGHLLWLWFAYASLMEGVGYLEITPFGAGDTASVVENLSWPSAVAWAFFSVGVAGQFLCAWGFAHPVGRIAGRDRATRLAASFWPWLIATAVNLVLTMLYVAAAKVALTPGEVTVIALAGMATIVFAPMALIFGRVSDQQPSEPLRLRPLPVAGLVAAGVLIAVNLLLTRGLQLG